MNLFCDCVYTCARVSVGVCLCVTWVCLAILVAMVIWDVHNGNVRVPYKASHGKQPRVPVDTHTQIHTLSPISEDVIHFNGNDQSEK